MTGSNITRNSAGENGGAIANFIDDSTATINFSRIAGNTAGESGSAIYCFDGSVSTENNWWGSNSTP
ncbi:MAG: hypothetical protein ABFC12_05195 [Methanobacterium sp.]